MFTPFVGLKETVGHFGMQAAILKKVYGKSEEVAEDEEDHGPHGDDTEPEDLDDDQ